MSLIRSRQQPRRDVILIAAALGMVAFALLVALRASGVALATSGGSPYDIPDVVDTNPAGNVVETTLIADEASVDIGNGVTAHAQTFNGTIPGPTFRLHVGDTVIVHYENHLDRPSAIHWHGIELENSMDGTPFTQNQVPAGGSFLYKFKISRPGLYWYHPHHHSSTDQVFKGLYGMIIVTDPNEAALQASGAIPSAAQTKAIVLSDTTVCKAPGSNDAATYDPALPWVGGGPLPTQAAPKPIDLCETSPIDEDGAARGPFAAGDIPNIQTAATLGRTNEGQTVLTNGKNVGGRAGDPAAPGALAGGASTLDVQAGQGLRLQFVNAATVRYFRLRLTDNAGTQVPLVRIGGEGGLLDNAVVEGGVIGGFDTKYGSGEILLPPGSRADVVAAIPAAATGVLTLWTEDYNRTGAGFPDTPTVPVMHLNVSGSAGTPYTIAAGTPLRAATGDLVAALGAATGSLLDPATFAPAKSGLALQDMRLTQTGSSLGIDDVLGTHDVLGDYSVAPHLGSTRYAKLGDTLELSATNTTAGAHHPYHLHGFSMQPISLTKSGSPSYVWPYHEYRDNIDIPPGYTLHFRIKLDDRALADGTTMGGGLGRWLFHCHIFFHATNGMLGELVIVSPAGNEKPDVNANITATPEINQGDTATVHGTFHDVDGGAVTLSSSIGSVSDDGGGTWTWTYDTTGASSSQQFVYVTATDSGGRKDQAVFILNVHLNSPPVVTADDASGNEGAAIAVHGTATDADGDSLTTAWTYVAGAGVDPGATCTFAAPGSVATTVSCTDDGTYTITLTANDGHNPPVSDDATLTVSNVAPAVSIASPADGTLFQLADTIDVSAPFSDAGANDTHTCSIAWGDGVTDAGVVVEAGGAGWCTGSHHYATGGHKTITVTVTDDDLADASASVTIDVNTPPDCNPVKPSPASLWPADHSLVLVTLSGATDADGDTVTLTVTGVHQDEPLNGSGDGDTSPDAKLVAGHSDQVKIRAERKSAGDGRVYKVTFGGDDGRGGTCTATKKVIVVHAKSDTTAVDSGLNVNSL